MLTFIICCPLAAAILLAFVPGKNRVVMRGVALLATLVSALLAVIMFVLFNGAEVAASGYRFDQQVPWVAALGISYHVGVDGINVGLVLMGAIVAFAAACVAWEIKEREKEFYILLLVMAGGILGAFASLDLFFFYFFHELALVPTFIMIGIWGRGEQKNYATFQITIYLSIGALLALVGLIALYVQSGAKTFDIPALTQYIYTEKHSLSLAAQQFIFPLLLFGFGILVSLWPFHTWAPLGYGSAPTPTAMLHAGVLKKFGLYGLIRIALPLLPDAAQGWMQVLAWLCLGNLVYCGWVAMRQKDFNRLIGYSSVAHMGFVFLGIASLTLIGVTGAVLVAIASPALRLQLIPADAHVLPSFSQSRQITEDLDREFASNGAQTISIVLPASPGSGARVAALSLSAQRTAGAQAREVAPPHYLGRGTWEIELLPRGTEASAANQLLVKRLRTLVHPAGALVGGGTAWFIDQKAAISSHVPLSLTILVCVTLGILFLMTGSVVLPLMALLMNLLTVAVGAGLLVLIFQDGHGSSLLGFSPIGGLEESNLVLLFTVAFALSTDYGVFLFSRIKEIRDGGLPTREAVAQGLERTGRLITAAALLFCVAVGAFATSHVFFIKQFGVGTALAVAIDATFVRALLVPALMGRLGERTWWAPRPLRRLHARVGLRELSEPTSA